MFGWSLPDLVWLLVGLLMVLGMVRARGVNKLLWSVFAAIVLSVPVGRALMSMSVQPQANADYIAAFALAWVALVVLLLFSLVFRPRGKGKKGKAKEGHGGKEGKKE